jgi:hypothetical protein
MISSRYPQVTDELLSAYLDQAVSDEEKRLVEEAIAAEPTIAWRLETLRQTVQLLRSLPALALPRSFALTELPEVAGQAVANTPAPAPARRPAHQPTPAWSWGVLWESWRSFWQVGSPLLRNAAAVSFALFLIVVAGDLVAGPAGLPQGTPVANAPLVAPAPTADEIAPSVTAAKVPEEESPAAAGSAVPAATQQPMAQAAPAQPPAVAVADESGVGAASVAAPVEAASAADGGDTALRTTGPGPDGGVELAPPSAGESAAENVPADSLSALLDSESSTTTAMLTATTGEITAAAPLSDTETITLPDVAAAEVQAPYAITDEAEDSATQPVATPAGPEPTTGAMPAGQAQPRSDSSWALQWLQLATALLTLLFVALWWRSRTRVVQSI